MNKKLIRGAVIVATWAAAMAAVQAWVAPAAGRATVMQLQASDPSYTASMLFVSLLAIGTVLLTVLFALALYAVVRATK